MRNKKKGSGDPPATNTLATLNPSVLGTLLFLLVLLVYLNTFISTVYSPLLLVAR